MSDIVPIVYLVGVVICTFASIWYMIAMSVSIEISKYPGGKFNGTVPWAVEVALETLRGRIRFCEDHHVYVGEYSIFYIPIWFDADNVRCVNYTTCYDRIKQVLNGVNDMLISKTIDERTLITKEEDENE